ncbi:hypothetical protein N7532_001737 [Penicillium argentinense]|uniref:Methyltransferase domain-containing protein n=1 Tax=Penicillium argentinense TaxID=1131581 RepID=A0A9W9G4N0_9EURO|nr:uncharacterized protein N7532_001737 [Penicillium argentinense]KAJ5111202.1 hypothetical protein N7532_001737 [Penicillium argentinense]
MAFERPLPISGVWENPDAYIEALLSFSTKSVLFMNLCGGVHMVDFLTREPDVYTTLLPENWRKFFDQHDVQDIIHLLLREDIEHLRDTNKSAGEESSHTWNGGAFPPQSLLDYIFNVRHLSLGREFSRSSLKDIELPKQVAMRMNKKKVHEVECFSQYVGTLSDTVHERRGERVSHIVDFGSGQNYLGRTLASSPYHKHIIAIERKHQYIDGAKGMDIRAKLAKDPKAIYATKDKKVCDDCNETSGVNTPGSPQSTSEGSPTSEDVPLANILGQVSIESDDLGSDDKNAPQESSLKAKIETRGTLSYVEHEISDGYLQPIIDHIVNPSHSRPLVEEGKEVSDGKLMVVSLHSCGNLVHHGLRSLVLNPSIAAVAMIGCCYNLLTERLGPATTDLPVLQSLHPRLEESGKSYDPHGFPMSKYYEDYRSPGATTGMKLNVTARALAMQAPYNWKYDDSEVSFTRHFFRALLQRILVDRDVLPKPSGATQSDTKADSIILGKLPKAAFKSFNAYFRAATTKMIRDPVFGSLVQENLTGMTDEDIHHYETEFSHVRKHISVMWSLMAFSSQLIESIIVVDRWQFLREQDCVKDCWVKPLFDYGESPRNLAVMGLKKA